MENSIVFDWSFYKNYKSYSKNSPQNSRPLLFRGIALFKESIIITCVGNKPYISILSKSGNELAYFETTNFVSPYGLCAGNNAIYITDIYLHCLLKYSPIGEFISCTGMKGGKVGEFNLPYGLIVANNGVVYVTDNRNNRIQTFTPDLELITSFGRDIFNKVSDVVSCVDGSIIVVDRSGRRLHRLSPDLYAVRTVQTKIVPAFIPTLFYPLFICLDAAENVLLSDRYSFCIQVFDSNLVHIGRFMHDCEPYMFEPKGAICDENGDIICLSDCGPFMRFFKTTEYIFKFFQ